MVSGNYFDGRKLTNGYMYLVTNQSMSNSGKLPWYNLGNGNSDVVIPFN